jgi:lipopolysaccharide assembly protein A
MSALRLFVALVVFVALLLLALSNAEPVTLRLFNVASTDSPLAFVVFVAFACGVATGLLAGVARTARLKRQLSRLRRDARTPPQRIPAPHGATPPPDVV